MCGGFFRTAEMSAVEVSVATARTPFGARARGVIHGVASTCWLSPTVTTARVSRSSTSVMDTCRLPSRVASIVVPLSFRSYGRLDLRSDRRARMSLSSFRGIPRKVEAFDRG